MVQALKRSGMPGNHFSPKDLKQRALKLIETKYSDFGPILAHEYLTEREGLKISVSTIRGLIVEKQYWVPKEK